MKSVDRLLERKWRRSKTTGEEYWGVDEDVLVDMCHRRDDGNSLEQLAAFYPTLPAAYVRGATACIRLFTTTEERDYIMEAFHQSGHTRLSDFILDLIHSGIQERGLVRVLRRVIGDND